MTESKHNSDDDEFHDAFESLNEGIVDMSLEQSINDSQIAIQYFFNNQFISAKNLIEPWSKISIYHALGNCVFSCMEAVLTFKHEHIIRASNLLKDCLLLCNKLRKKKSFGDSFSKMLRKDYYNSYNEEELHAEVCYAEALLLKSLLTFLEDETLSSFLKGGLRIRSCFNIYKECNNILMGKKWKSSNVKMHFESGVRFGIGSFNLMISMLPSKVIKLLEFIGFSGEKEFGLKELEAGYRLNGGLRQVLCGITLLGYHLVIQFFINNHENVPNICEHIINEQLKVYPNGIWFQYFNGRLNLMKGDLNESIMWYKKSWKSQNTWPQFHHLCFWELLWVHCLQLNWKEAVKYANYLLNESYWSRTIYSYQTAAILYMMIDDLNQDDKKKIDLLMRNGPVHKRRIAGKSLPMEKFAINKSNRYFEQNNYLVLPAIELLFLWNFFKILKRKSNSAQQIYRLIEKELQQWSDPNQLLDNNKTEENNKKIYYDYDNLGLILLLKGSCLRVMDSPLQAMECFERILTLEEKIVEDKYIIPFTIYEMALIVYESGDKIGALNLIQNIKRKYNGYPLESRLHFKMHSLLTDINHN